MKRKEDDRRRRRGWSRGDFWEKTKRSGVGLVLARLLIIIWKRRKRRVIGVFGEEGRGRGHGVTRPDHPTTLPSRNDSRNDRWIVQEMARRIRDLEKVGGNRLRKGAGRLAACRGTVGVRERWKLLWPNLTRSLSGADPSKRQLSTVKELAIRERRNLGLARRITIGLPGASFLSSLFSLCSRDRAANRADRYRRPFANQLPRFSGWTLSQLPGNPLSPRSERASGVEFNAGASFLPAVLASSST